MRPLRTFLVFNAFDAYLFEYHTFGTSLALVASKTLRKGLALRVLCWMDPIGLHAIITFTPHCSALTINLNIKYITANIHS